MIAADLEKIHVQLTHHVLAISAPTVHSGPTCRPAAVVLWSANGRPFCLEDGAGTPIWRGDAAIVAPHFVRTLQAQDCFILSVNFEPDHPWLPSLSRMVGDTGLLPIERRRVNAFSDDMHAAISRGCAEGLDHLAADLAASLVPRKIVRRRTDRRVAAVIARLGEDLCSPPSVAELAREAGVSPDRLSHLLAAEIGIPYRSYVLWRKYRRALALLQEKQSLSWVAQAAGFYDQAHMARTFLSYFGYPPSVVREQGLVLGRT